MSTIPTQVLFPFLRLIPLAQGDSTDLALFSAGLWLHHSMWQSLACKSFFFFLFFLLRQFFIEAENAGKNGDWKSVQEFYLVFTWLFLLQFSINKTSKFYKDLKLHLLEIAGLCNFEFFENTYPWVYRTRNRAIFSTSRRLFHVLAINAGHRQLTQCNIHCLADIEWKKSLGPVQPFMRMPHKSHYFELRMKDSTFEPLGVMSQIRGALVASPVHKQSCALDVAEVAGSAELVRNWRSHLSCTWCWIKQTCIAAGGCKVPFFLFSYSIPMCPCMKIMFALLL